ncbi:MAG: alpha/beta fold hydrolase [Leucobacter sp.]
MAERNTGALVGAVVGGAAAAVAVGVVGTAAIGTALARLVVTPARRPEERVSIEGVERRDGTALVWLRGEDVALPGRYSLLFDEGAGHARVGEVLERRAGAVARAVLAVDRGQLRPGGRGRITGWWFTGPEDLEYRVEAITYPTELGDAPAWIIRPKFARKRRWAIHVHGRGAQPEETLRGVAPLARAGITSLVIAYRNDTDAPAGERGRYGAGVSESRDVDAAIAEALRRGAERVTLFGWSMGGTACLIAAARGEHVDAIDGLILDSPAIDWPSLLRHQAGGMRVPGPVAGVGIRMLDRGWVRGGEPKGIPLESLVPETFARELRVPVLLHASSKDTFVPSEPAEQLARLRPDLVQLRLQESGEHVKLWNVDPEPWERATESFARALPRPPWRG